MKGPTRINKNVPLKEARNLRYSKGQKNRETANFPELKRRLAHSTKPHPEGKSRPGKTKLYIKNMVSIRCKMVVTAVLENLGLNFSLIELGEVEIVGKLSETKHKQLKSRLSKYGFELMDDKKVILVEKIKLIIVELVHYQNELPHETFSEYLSEKLNYNYTYLSNLFSEVKGIPIQHYVMLHKIERVKELLVYDELSLKEIAYLLHYSSIAHLSNQFKNITGLTPTEFKNIKHKRLLELESI